MKVKFGCPHCGHAVELEPGTEATCAQCGRPVSLPEAKDLAVAACLACGCPELYRHRDFNQRVGLALLALGVLLWWLFESFWPMVAAAAIDLLLFRTLPDVAICYRCKAHHRDFDGISALPAFDLERHEHYKWVRRKDAGA